jgi:hypothetical protein
LYIEQKLVHAICGLIVFKFKPLTARTGVAENENTVEPGYDGYHETE